MENGNLLSKRISEIRKRAEENVRIAKERAKNSPEAKEAEELACKPIELTKYRNERNLMLFPFCSTSKRKRLQAIEYRSSDGKRWLQVTANHNFGMAKIWDFDILRFAISKAGEIKKYLGYFPPFVEFTAYECLKAIGRKTNTSKNYVWLEEALARLVGTTYRGNIFREEINIVSGFTLISAEYIKEKEEILGIRITFNERLLESIQNQNGLLAIDSDVIREESGIKKRLLELVKVSKGSSEIWEVKLSRLKEMCAHEGAFKEFRRLLKSFELPWKVNFSKILTGEEKVTFSDR
jgi:hypothetical protein